MKKEALINIIINDLKEVEELMESFRGEPSVNSAFVELATKKIRNIEEEIFLLNRAFGDAVLSSEGKVREKRKEVGDVKNKAGSDGGSIAESSSRFFSEEAGTPEIEPGEKTGKGTSGKKEKVAEKADEVRKTVKPAEKVKEKELKPKQPEKPVTVAEDEQKKKVETVSGKPAGARKKGTVRSARLGDVLKKNKNALNEKVTLKETENDLIFAKPVDDIRKAMGINDRFLYQRELFKSNSQLFDQTLDQLNQMKSFSDANNFLASNFDWDMENEPVNSFLKIVKRRFL